MGSFGLSGNKKQIFGFTLLFIVVLLLSVLAQLPANWVLSNTTVKQAIEHKFNSSQSLKILASRGTIWQGEVDLAIENNASKDMSFSRTRSIGKVAWNLHLLPILITKLSADIDWKIGQSSLSGELSTQLLTSVETKKLYISEVDGAINLKDLISKLPFKKIAQSPFTKELAGLVKINHFEAEYLVNAKWFSLFKSDIQMNDLLIMNNAFPTLNLQANLQDELIDARLNGQQIGWVLNGTASLNKSYGYKVDLNLKATSEKNLPDWAFLMQRKSAANYVTKLQGRLF